MYSPRAVRVAPEWVYCNTKEDGRRRILSFPLPLCLLAIAWVSRGVARGEQIHHNIV